MDWMMWTLPSALFFVAIGLILAGMTVWEVISPTTERKGFLPLTTTRGDRLFIGLLSSGYLHLAWVGLTEQPVWWMTVAVVCWVAALLRWG